jgi:hypothetical protein
MAESIRPFKGGGESHPVTQQLVAEWRSKCQDWIGLLFRQLLIILKLMPILKKKPALSNSQSQILGANTRALATPVSIGVGQEVTIVSTKG